MRHQFFGPDHVRERGSQGEDRINRVSIFAMQQHRGWITIKPMPSAEAAPRSPWTVAFQPGNQATWTERRSAGWRLARMRALLAESHWKAAAGRAASPVACAYWRISAYSNLPGGRCGTSSSGRTTCASEAPRGRTE